MLQSTIQDTRKALQRRAFRKKYSVPLHVNLAELRNEREQYYRNGIYCAERIEQGVDGRLRTHYCNGRLCPICQAIRTAKGINKYLPAIQSFADPYFLTLTRRTVQGEHLRPTIRQMKGEFSLINDLARKNGKVHGLRKLEVIYNGETGLYHPHFHMILDGEEVASFVLKEWLKRNRFSAHRDAQELQAIEPGDSTGIRKLFGYITKLVTEVEEEKIPVPSEALDVIVAALFNSRTLQPYGSLIQAARDTEKIKATDVEAYETPYGFTIGKWILWEWEQRLATWVDKQTGALLVEPPTEKIRVKNNRF
ncbi:MAG: protein rep [Ignavibacteriae bacterium]|nr:protein rep [Ignavibacteriota bacterium]MCB9216624.1 protein rep [Ignavibacteria bacterium]